ncbi:catechol 2,3-dioxygenase-like lactoylglutathione lyase family enzyme [Arthrobacter stackebrandtii]|uniref:Catechol 2,3-dioxygenase-like lactoylglutathione lyase family enzyme n=1 Tax=Arthrobacter stackebrandtii TaxID=272161 RepID=A0ABS4YVA1_9MICC|nr:VOC family protein [Arthrobacter stackebrandtii]MBP2412530.1 catechol 2,3-dioxygenase-like lactoylglutathione lyase family enzyme [Arthrobacter stackebrandtii]
MEQVSVRYIVHDVDAALDFYVRLLGFTEVMHPAPGFAMLTLGGLRLLLSAPGSVDAKGAPGGGGRATPDGAVPAPGGWNRFSLQMPDLDAEASRLSAAGVHFRGGIIEGIGVRQILLEDPSGNLVELFEPLLPEASHKLF